jgi:hypothetical protein
VTESCRQASQLTVIRTSLIAAVLVISSFGASAAELRNWFDDPFFQVTSAVPGCPEPAGPRVTAAERLAQSHRRAEKGTTCWLAKEEGCQRAIAFAYDRDIASEIRAAMQASGQFRDTSLWITVQGRVVYAEGCVAREAQGAEVEQLVRSLPHVQQVISIVMVKGKAAPPYRLIGAR